MARALRAQRRLCSKTRRGTCLHKDLSQLSSYPTPAGCIPCVVLWFSLCCLSRVSVTSSSAESRLQQRGWSSLGGLMASSFSSSDAELRRDGFLSRARFRKERMVRLQSSAMSSRGGACLWICRDRDHGSEINKTLTNPK